MSKIYKTLFFDLDRTLWDYQSNSEQTLAELLIKYAPELRNSSKEFIDVYYEVNDKLWLDYRDGKISKSLLSDTRFIEVFNRFNINARPFSDEISNEYIIESPKKTKLFPHTLEVLTYLQNKGYRLFLLTNGFSEIQFVKARESKLAPFFEQIITSEEAGFQKPHPEIFDYAMKIANANKAESIMIGDDLESDISGADRFGMDTVLFNPNDIRHATKPTYEIKGLEELLKIF